MTKLLLCALAAGMMLTLMQTLASAAATPDKPLLHPLFTDNMVLQRGIAAPIWGWTEPGRRVTVGLAGRRATTVAGSDGKWMARLGPFVAGGPHTLTVSGPRTLTVNNVLIGDVWICSGQSNMQWSVSSSNNAQQEIANAKYPGIRLFTVPNVTSAEPKELVNSQWQVCSPETIGGFSAVAYYFGRQLHQELKVPIGLINSSWGGTIAEAWVSGEALETMPDFRPAVAQVRQSVADQQKGEADYEQKLNEWWARNDPGSANGNGWADPAADTALWNTMPVPQQWEQAGLPNFDGVVWFRRDVELPESWAGKDLLLHLGPIDDRDTTWFNGTRVGAQNQYNSARHYRIPGNLVKAGRNVIAVRVLDTGGGGGFSGKPEDISLEIAPGGAASGAASALPLAGPWLYRVSTPLAQTTPVPLQANNNPNVPTVLYNAMIAPLVPFGIRGATWYQGESNVGRAVQYRTLLPTLIQDWRSRFGVGRFPFLIVQLANYLATRPEPGESAWAELREAQYLTTRNDPKAGLAVAIDIGEAGDIHPRNKQDVGRRLALAALGIGYGRRIEYSGPVYRGMKREGNALRLYFDHTGGGLMAPGARLQGFSIAGEDKKWVWADARIEGRTVVVSAPDVPNPTAVRYGWADNPIANFYNKAGLPASPFRTDINPS